SLELFVHILGVIGESAKPLVVQNLRHRQDLLSEAVLNADVDCPSGLQDLDAAWAVTTQSMGPIDGLHVIHWVERPVDINRVLTGPVQADSLAGGGRVRDHHPARRILMESSDASFARVLILSISGWYLAVDQHWVVLSQALSKHVKVHDKRRPQEDAF